MVLVAIYFGGVRLLFAQLFQHEALPPRLCHTHFHQRPYESSGGTSVASSIAQWHFPKSVRNVLVCHSYLSNCHALKSLSTDSGSVHDPSVILRDDGTYFHFSTVLHFNLFLSNRELKVCLQHNNISIQTTKDLSGTWSNVGSVLPHGATHMEDIPGWVHK